MAGTTEEALLIHGRARIQRGSGVGFEAIKRILSYFFRFESLGDLEGDIIELNHILVDRMSEGISVSKSAVINVMSRFLSEMDDFLQLLKSEFVAWAPM